MKMNSTTTIAAVVVIGAGGFFIGRLSQSSPDGSGGSADAAGISQRSSSRSSGDGRPEGERTRTSRRESSMGREERLAKLESIVRGENALDRNRALLAYIDQLGPGDFEAAVAHFRTLGITESRLGEYSLLLTAWAKVDPLAALGYAKENTRGTFASSTILASWATTDPDAAIRWAESNHEGDGPNPHMIGVIRGIAGSDPARATELLAGMPMSNQRGEALAGMLPHILKQGPEASRAWVAGLTDDPLKQGAMTQMAEPLALIDPKGTSDWLLANPGEAANRRMDDVYSTWARSDLNAALSGMNSISNAGARSDALSGIVEHMAPNNPKEALALMDRYPGDVNDRVVRDFVRGSLRSDPAVAAGSIARIADEGERNNTYRRAIGDWIERDAAGAQAWIQSNALPEAVQRDLARRLDHVQRRQ